MCTVVCHWDPTGAIPVQLLALRDELASRHFDLPGRWWPAQPQLVGGRDRLGGGTWCASHIGTGTTAVVLNRPERRLAEPGAPSRGVLPLLAAERLADWPDAIELAGMASFNLVLIGPDELAWWSYDGQRLQHHRLQPGTHMFTPRGLAEPPDRRFVAVPPGGPGRHQPELNEPAPAQAEPAEQAWAGWLPILQQAVPSPDPMDLLVRLPVTRDSAGGQVTDSFETVFGQFIAAARGQLRLDFLPTPDRGGQWTTAHWSVEDGPAGS